MFGTGSSRVFLGVAFKLTVPRLECPCRETPTLEARLLPEIIAVLNFKHKRYMCFQ